MSAGKRGAVPALVCWPAYARVWSCLYSCAQRHHLGRRLLFAHQLSCTIRHRVGRGEQHGIGRMHIAGRYRAALVTNQRGNGRLRITEIPSKAGERMPQDVRRYIRRQLAEFRDSRP